MWSLTSHIEALVPLNHEEHQQKETKMVSTPRALALVLTLALEFALALTLTPKFAFTLVTSILLYLYSVKDN